MEDKPKGQAKDMGGGQAKGTSLEDKPKTWVEDKPGGQAKDMVLRTDGECEGHSKDINKCLFHMVNQSSLCCSKWELL